MTRCCACGRVRPMAVPRRCPPPRPRGERDLFQGVLTIAMSLVEERRARALDDERGAEAELNRLRGSDAWGHYQALGNAVRKRLKHAARERLPEDLRAALRTGGSWRASLAHARLVLELAQGEEVGRAA